MSSILILGYSNLVQKRIIPALDLIDSCKTVEIASQSKLPLKSGKICNTYSDYIEALNSYDGNLVYISLHNSVHDYYIIESIKRGLNCIVDKPAILNLESIEILNDLTNANNCIVAESVVYYYHKAWDSMINKLEGPENIFHIDSHFTIPELDKDNFRMNPRLGGGVENDMSSYSVSVGRQLWQREPQSICITNLNIENKLVKGFNISIDYGDNRSLRGVYGFGYEYKNEILMSSNTGECGYERVFSPPADFGVKLKGYNNNKPFEEKNIEDDTFKNFFLHFFDSLNKKPSSYWLNKIFDSYNDLQMLKKAINTDRRI